MTRPARIAHVFATFGRGGPQVRAVALMRRLGAAAGHLVMAMDGVTDAAASLGGGAELELVAPPARRGALAVLRHQCRWLRAAAPDLVLTYNWGAIESAAAARRLGLPLVHHEDGFGPDEARGRFRRRAWLRRLVLRRTPVIVPSTALVAIAQREWGLPAPRVLHLPNGVDLQHFAPGPAVAAAVLGSVGGLRAEKDHATLLRAAALLPAAVRLELVGQGPCAAALRALAAELGIAARAAFVGQVDDPAPCYRRFQVFVLSSVTEQMPIALLEAMACGLPVVATDVGDVRNILPPSAADCIVPPRDPVALARAIERLLGDADLRCRLGDDNRRTVAARYEACACLDRFLGVYAATAGRPLQPG